MPENKSLPLVSVIVLNYNGKKFLKDCFDTVLASTYPNFELIMVDNDSTDDSVSFTRENYQEIEIIETGVNGGYSLAYNISGQKARGKYIVLLNNDVTVEPDWLEPLVEAAEKDDNIGALQPKLVSMIDPTNFEYAGASGGFMDKYGFPFLRGRVFDFMEKDKGQYDDITRIFWATGAALFIKKDVFVECGMLDEDFVHHMEEIDMCWRLNLLGYKLYVIPESKIYHFGGATIRPDSFKKMYWNHRNSIFMLYKNLGPENLNSVLFGRWLLDLLAIVVSIVKFEFKRAHAIIKGHFWLLQNRGLLKKKRLQVQEMRKVKEEKIQELLFQKSIALQFFLKKKRTFSDLMGKRKQLP